MSAQIVEVEGTFRDALKLDAAKLPLLNIYYIYGVVGFRFIMFQTIANGDPDPRCPV